MGVKTVPQPPYSPDLAPYDFWLFPKLRGCRYETIEEIKEVVTKIIDTLTQEDFHGALQKLLERYNKCIAAGGDYFEGDESFMCVLSIKVAIRNSLMILVYSILCALTWRPRPAAARSTQCSSVSAWAGAFARIAMSLALSASVIVFAGYLQLLFFFSLKPFSLILSIDVLSRLSRQMIKRYGVSVSPQLNQRN